MNPVKVAIVGAGVSGLYAASLLQKAGVSFVMLEARAHTGGRVMSCHAQNGAKVMKADSEKGSYSFVDLGATWVWPSFQPQLADLLDELDIELISQCETGDMLHERDLRTPPSRYPGFESSPSSMRLAGGMHLLTARLRERISPEAIHTDRNIKKISLVNGRIELQALSAQGNAYNYHAEHVLLALPPALTAAIEFTPALPVSLKRGWMSTGTWMAPHAKYVAVYENDFWRSHSLSGEARSGVGPLVEIHDASVPGGVSALFGFVGVPAKTRWTTTEENLVALCRAQMVRIFGEDAGHPIAEFFKDWASDNFTATEYDLIAQAGHSVPASSPVEGPWKSIIKGIASEWSPLFPGYLAGAIDAAHQGVQEFRSTENLI